MRQRIEDLGRLAVLLKNLTEHPIFEKRLFRSKDYLEWFTALSDKERDDVLYACVYGI